MNMRFTLALIRHFNNKNQGFALVLVLCLGIVMILAGAMVIARSHSDQNKAIAQKAEAEGFSAAESGVTRIMDLINGNRMMALYPSCVTPNVDGTCADSGTSVKSWFKAPNVPNTCDKGNTTDSSHNNTYVSNVASGTSQPMGSVEYKLISYDYPINGGTVGVPPGTGRIIVSGKARSGNALTTAQSNIIADISIKDRKGTTKVPGLWVKKDRTTKMGADKVNGDILITACTKPTGSGQPTDANVTSGHRINADPTQMPDTPSLPSSGQHTDLTAKNLEDYNNDDDDGNNSTVLLPLRTSDPQYNGAYHYLVKNIILNGSKNIVVRSGLKVVLYVQGNVKLSGNPDLNPDASNQAKNLVIYGNTYTSSTTSKYGCGSLSFIAEATAIDYNDSNVDTDCPTRIAHFNGTGTMKAFVHAPAATASINGGGTTNGNFRGAVWANDWDSSSGDDKVKVDAEGYYTDYAVTSSLILPQISQVCFWTQQPINASSNPTTTCSAPPSP